MSLPLPTINTKGASDLELRMDIINRLNQAANACKDKRNFHAAELMYRRALAMVPENDKNAAILMTNVAAALFHSGKFKEAERYLIKALDINPDYCHAWGNLALVEQALGNTESAESKISRAIEIDPKNVGAIWDRATIFLENGKWEQGLIDYASRIEFRGDKYYRSFPVPMWQGEDLNGKTIYVQGEQGIGDRMLFSRYLVWLKEAYPSARILYCCNANLINLLWEYRHFVEFLPENIPWPDDIDYATFVGNLPFFHGTRPGFVPPEPGLIKARIAQHLQTSPLNLPEPFMPSLKVGICWTGNPENIRNQDRSIPLEMLAQLADDPRVVLYSLQVGPGAQDITDLSMNEIVCDLSNELEKYSWIGTGAVVQELDLIITVCTSVAHLAGALQVPCWTLLCNNPYWIWLREGNKTNWYPNMKLYRQDNTWDWQPVIAKVKKDLHELLKQRLS